MRTRVLAVAACTWIALLASGKPAVSAPVNGMAAYAGVTAHVYQETVHPGGNTIHYQSSGASAAGDLQFVINPKWSLNPALSITYEDVTGDVSGTASNGMATIQGRRWFGDYYLGAQVGAYFTVLATKNWSNSRRGDGAGVAAGYEAPEGWCYEVLLDDPFGTSAIAALQLQIGYRWH